MLNTEENTKVSSDERDKIDEIDDPYDLYSEYEEVSESELTPEKIKEIYDEANFFFEEKITKRLEEAQEFHNNLIQNRKKRLSIELNDLNIDLISNCLLRK